jgi:hypothetical protein
MSNTQQSRRFALVDSEGDLTGAPRYADPAIAWSQADALNNRNAVFGPWSVVELVPVPKPVPPRPSVTISGTEITHDGRGWYYIGTRSTNRAWIAARDCDATDAETSALLDLPEATRAWKREHGGAA